MNPDAYMLVRELVLSDGGEGLDQEFISKYVKNRQVVDSASDNCTEAFSKGISLMNNYNANHRSGTNSNKCALDFRGDSAE